MCSFGWGRVTLGLRDGDGGSGVRYGLRCWINRGGDCLPSFWRKDMHTCAVDESKSMRKAFLPFPFTLPRLYTIHLVRSYHVFFSSFPTFSDHATREQASKNNHPPHQRRLNPSTTSLFSLTGALHTLCFSASSRVITHNVSATAARTYNKTHTR